MALVPRLIAGVIAGCVGAAAQPLPYLVPPVIRARDEARYEAMKSAPVIVLAEFTSATPSSAVWEVKKPAEVGGPMAPTIPMGLMQISARVLVSIRGSHPETVRFYGWVYAGGSHGGSRLFNPRPGSIHVVFLREDGGILHTVGDYPAYDVEVETRWLAAFVSEWGSQDIGSNLLERIVAAHLKAEFGGVPDGDREYFSPGLQTLIGITNSFFVARQLDMMCHQLANPTGRSAACYTAAQAFPGRCQDYRLAMEADTQPGDGLRKVLEHCEASTAETISDLRAANWPLPDWESSWSITPERHRLAMRFYASAIDPEFHQAACEAARVMPEARDIPECPSH
jgi:hypothetical protein